LYFDTSYFDRFSIGTDIGILRRRPKLRINERNEGGEDDSGGGGGGGGGEGVRQREGESTAEE